jgi:NNP family nitrate/nitrite transporter-like MFS transporter
VVDKACPTPEPFKAVVWSIVFLTLLFFLTFISRFIFAPLMPAIGQDLGITPGQAGSVFLIGSLGVFVASICSGFVSSRFNHRGTLIVSTLGVCLALLGCYFTSSLWGIRIVMLVLGIAAGLNLPSNVATITAMVTRQDWGKALAVQQMAPPLSLVLGPLLTIVFLTWFSWRIPLVFLGCFSLVVALAFFRLGRIGDFPGDAPSPSLVKFILTQRSFWLMILLFALGMGCQVGIYAMLPLYLVTERGLEAGSANALVGFSQISALFMTFVAGWITDRIGEKRTIALVFVASGIVTVLIGSLSGLWLKVVVFLQPALIVCYFPPGFAALSRIVQPYMRSLAASMAPPTAFLLGGGLLPAALGYMGQAYTFALGIKMTGCMIILGSLLVMPLKLLEKMEDGC